MKPTLFLPGCSDVTCHFSPFAFIAGKLLHPSPLSLTESESPAVGSHRLPKVRMPDTRLLAEPPMAFLEHYNCFIKKPLIWLSVFGTECMLYVQGNKNQRCQDVQWCINIALGHVSSYLIHIVKCMNHT